MVVVNGWQIFAHPLFLDQIERLTEAVEQAHTKNPTNYQRTANAKVLASLRTLVLDTIPSDPTRAAYRRGMTPGTGGKHGFRAKFGGQRFRLFQYSTQVKIIIFAWVNDSDTLRPYGSKSDTYAVSRLMLDQNNPPDDWSALMAAATSAESMQRLRAIGMP